MSIRRVEFVNNHYYHVFNRGVDKRPIYLESDDFNRFLQSMIEFNNINPIGSIFENAFKKNQFGDFVSTKSRLVNIICYCLNPNHYHFILEQVADDGIKKFMHRLGTGFTKYFNIKYKRSGTLFSGKFKAISIDSNEYLLHLSAYVNLNNQVHSLGSKASKSSWEEYQNHQIGLSHKNIILKQFANITDYVNFSRQSLVYIQERKDLSKLLLE
jgi:putative transposase